MRLHEVYKICRDNLIGVDALDFKETKSNNIIFYQMERLEIFQEALQSLGKINALKPYIVEIYQKVDSLTIRGVKSIRIDSTTKNAIVKYQNTLIEKCNTIIELCESLEYNDIKQGFNVKIPMNEDFSKFSTNISSFSKVLDTCPYLRKPDTSIELVKVDVGSAWLEFCIKGTAAITLVAALAAVTDKAIMLRSHILSCKQQEVLCRQMEMDNALIEQLIKTNESITNAYTKELVKQLSTDLLEEGNELDEEEKSRAEMTLKILTDLIDQGLEIHDAISIDAEQVQLLFPSSDKWQDVLEGSSIKLLEDFSKKEESETE